MNALPPHSKLRNDATPRSEWWTARLLAKTQGHDEYDDDGNDQDDDDDDTDYDGDDVDE